MLYATPPSHVSSVVVNTMAAFNKDVQLIVERGNSLLPYVAVWVATSLPPLLGHGVLANDLILKLSKLSLSDASIIHQVRCIRNWCCSIVEVRIRWWHCLILGHIVNRLRWWYSQYWCCWRRNSSLGTGVASHHIQSLPEFPVSSRYASKYNNRCWRIGNHGRSRSGLGFACLNLQNALLDRGILRFDLLNRLSLGVVRL